MAEKELLVKLNVKPIGDTGLAKIAKDARVAAAEVDRLSASLDQQFNKRTRLSRATRNEFALDFARGKAFAAGRGLPDLPAGGHERGFLSKLLFTPIGGGRIPGIGGGIPGIGGGGGMGGMGLRGGGLGAMGQLAVGLGAAVLGTKLLADALSEASGKSKDFSRDMEKAGAAAKEHLAPVWDITKNWFLDMAEVAETVGFDKLGLSGIETPFGTEETKRQLELRRQRRARQGLLAGEMGSLEQEELRRRKRDEEFRRLGEFRNLGEQVLASQIASAATKRGLTGIEAEKFGLEERLKREGKLAATAAGKIAELALAPGERRTELSKDPIRDRELRLEEIVRQQEALELSQRKLLALEQEKLELIREEGEQRVKTLQITRDQAAAEEDRLKAIVEAEKQKLQGLKAGFGLLDPETQQAIKQLAGKVAAGGQLTPEELDFAQRHQQFFQAPLERIGLERAEAMGFDQIARQLGLTKAAEEAQARQAEAERTRIEIEQKIEAELTLNAESVAEQLQRAVWPALLNLMQTMEDRLRDREELERLREANARAAGFRG